MRWAGSVGVAAETAPSGAPEEATRVHVVPRLAHFEEGVLNCWVVHSCRCMESKFPD